MKNDKSPGTDGLSVNFYKTLWPVIGNIVLDSLNYGYNKGELSPEQTRGLVTLILKPNKDSNLLQNYRPITLLNTDYKIGAKAIASRLKSVINELIGSHQTGFLKNRFIGENIRFILDVIDHSNYYDMPGFIFLVDFEKAFDNIAWASIHITLSYFNFGISFKSWINVFYHNSTILVSVIMVILQVFLLSKEASVKVVLSVRIYSF